MQNDIKLRAPLFDISFWLSILLGIAGIILIVNLARTFLPHWLITIVIVVIGFGLPRWKSRATRKERAAYYKEKEMQKWGFCGRDHEGPWVNYIDHPLVVETHFAKGKHFCSDWLCIDDGLIIVNPGESQVDKDQQQVEYDYAARCTYAWDGCTPKRFFYWLLILGTPDWWPVKEKILIINKAKEIVPREKYWPLAHHASLVHDALYQYLGCIPISKRNVDILFYHILLDSGMWRPIAKIYHLAVHFFGAFDVGEDEVNENHGFKASFVPGLKKNENQE